MVFAIRCCVSVWQMGASGSRSQGSCNTPVFHQHSALPSDAFITERHAPQPALTNSGSQRRSVSRVNGRLTAAQRRSLSQIRRRGVAGPCGAKTGSVPRVLGVVRVGQDHLP